MIGALVLALLAAVFGLLSREGGVPPRTGGFLDQYLAAIPWGLALMAAPVLVIGLWIVGRRPVLIVFALAVLLPLNLVGQGGEGRLLALGKVVVNLLFALSVGSVLWAPREWREWLRTSSIGWWLCALCACLGFSAVQGYFAGYNLYEWMRELGWLAFWAFAIPVGVFVRDRDQLKVLMTVLVVMALVAQVAAFYLLVAGQRSERAEDWLGSGGYFRAPFSEGMRFVLLWALASLLALRRPQRGGRWRIIGFAALALVLGIGLLASLGRSLWLSTFIAGLVLIALAPRDRHTATVLLAVLAGAVLAAVGIELLDRLSPFSSGQWLSDAFGFAMALVRGQSVSSTIGREVEWQNAVRLWLQSPIVGNGVGAPFAQDVYNPADLAAFYTHNSYLNILAKLGVVGLTAFSAVVLSAFNLLRRVGRATTPASADYVLAITIAAYLVGVLSQSAVAPFVTTTDSAMFFSLALGLSVALARMAPAPAAPA